jgi:hypothetical protein
MHLFAGGATATVDLVEFYSDVGFDDLVPAYANGVGCSTTTLMSPYTYISVRSHMHVCTPIELDPSSSHK